LFSSTHDLLTRHTKDLEDEQMRYDFLAAVLVTVAGVSRYVRQLEANSDQSKKQHEAIMAELRRQHDAFMEATEREDQK
jgi:hypothetical protein